MHEKDFLLLVAIQVPINQTVVRLTSGQCDIHVEVRDRASRDYDVAFGPQSVAFISVFDMYFTSSDPEARILPSMA